MLPSAESYRVNEDNEDCKRHNRKSWNRGHVEGVVIKGKELILDWTVRGPELV
jgi:hypothetical protein